MTTIGMVVFPGFELLDLAGPLDVFARAPDVKALTIAQTRELVLPDLAPAIAPDVTFDDAPPLDVLFVPGGHGIGASFANDKLLDFVATRAKTAQYITSVCTGALLLGVAGLLKGRKATTHWRYLDLLKLLGAKPVSKRVVEDGNLITGAGVTAGMDFGFALVARLRGADTAKRLQLGLEYDPDPPFRAGHPSVADKADVETYVRDTTARYDERERLIRDAVTRRAL
ncbi:MAG TPA: DJ-1/PfpI family protein [Candidatus Eremiobacteraceae bacterium]|nr:DJ-1/PfpI family protein [Candidatus Eremiobacteraceae bacterium]